MFINDMVTGSYYIYIIDGTITSDRASELWLTGGVELF